MEEKECPICGEVKPVESGFGYRQKPEGLRPNSWCRSCRGTGKIKSQYAREREQSQPRHNRVVKEVKVRMLQPGDLPTKLAGPSTNTIHFSETAEFNGLSDALIEGTNKNYERTKALCESTAKPEVSLTKLTEKAQKYAERNYLRELYHRHRPNDKNWASRSINFIRQRLKLGKWGDKYNA